MQLLEDIDPDEVSVVKRGANQRPWLILKAEDDGNMHVDAELADVLAVPTDHEGAMTDTLRKEGVSEAGQRAAVAALRLLKGFEDEDLLDHILKANTSVEDDEEDEDDQDADDVDKMGTLDGDTLKPPTKQVSDGKSGADRDGSGSGANRDGSASGAGKDGSGSGKNRDGSASGQESVTKRQFSSDQRDADANSGAALPDGSFPIENTSDLKNAVRAIGRAKDRVKAMAHIKSRAKALGATNLLPDDWGSVSKSSDQEEHDMSEGTVTVPVIKEDGSLDPSVITDPDARAAWDSVLKAQDDLKSQVEKAEKQAAEASETLRSKEFVQKAEGYGHIAPADELGMILKEASEKLEPETFEKLETVLKGVEGKIATSTLFKEFGSTARADGDAGSDPYAKIEKMADEMVAKGDMSRDEAISKVLETSDGKRIYSEYLQSALGGGVS